MRKRDLVLDNERLKAEVGYLRGQVAELQKGAGAALDAASRIVETTLSVAFPGPETAPSSPAAHTLPPIVTDLDWTDLVAPEDVNGLTIAESLAEEPQYPGQSWNLEVGDAADLAGAGASPNLSGGGGGHG